MALRPARMTDLSPKTDHLKMQPSHERGIGGKECIHSRMRIFIWGNDPDPPYDSSDMCVDREVWLVKREQEYNARGLVPDSG